MSSLIRSQTFSMVLDSLGSEQEIIWNVIFHNSAFVLTNAQYDNIDVYDASFRSLVGEDLRCNINPEHLLVCFWIDHK